MIHDENTNDFFYSESLKDRVNREDFIPENKRKGSASGVNKTDVIFRFVEEQQLICRLTGWDAKSITVSVPASHLLHFYDVGENVTVEIFGNEKSVRNCTAKKDDGKWLVTVYFLDDI